ncbi:MAG: adenosylcobinamide-GDP ribazoletransferase [Paracoccaceae bacterium]
MTMAAISQRLGEIRMGFMILSRLPMGEIRGPVPDMGASAWSWPIVGAVIGVLAATVHGCALGLGVPPVLAASLAILAGVMATGGLHEDGLADLADGFGGGRTRERRLEIMRDSRIGSYGALALGFSLIIRIIALSSLSAGCAPAAIVALAIASRAPLPAALFVMPSARDDGLGRSAAQVAKRSVLVAAVLGIAALFALGVCVGAITGAVIGLCVLALGLLAKARIGGQTGDVLGAMQQVAELSGWICLSALLS